MRFDGTRLKTLRVSRKWDQHRLAEAARSYGVGITQSQISRYENGQEPSGRNCLALASALSVEVGDLYENGSAANGLSDDGEPRAMTLDDFLRARIQQLLREEMRETVNA